jgi:DHA2 family multidrug resistance protein
VWWERQHPQPVMDVRLFRIPSFAAANVVMLLVGFALYSTTQLIPQFAQTLLDYDSLTAGKTLALGGMAAALVMPIAGIAASKVAPRVLVGFGILATGLALLHMATMTGQIAFVDLSLTRVYQSLSLPFLFVSLTTAGYVGVPPDRNNEASAIINLCRNLGGSIGIATATTMFAHREQFHHARLGEWASEIGTRGALLAHDGLASAQRLVDSQAQLLSYLDIFWLFGMIAIAVVPAAFFLKSPPPGQAHGH